MRIPVDHALNRFYRRSAGLMGVVLLVFGVLGFAQRLEFFSTDGQNILGLSSNGLLSLISVVVGLVLVGGAFVGGNVAAWLNLGFGVAFLLSGLVNLTVLRTSLNFLAFDMPNVIFSFVAGLVLLTCGLYGRVSGGLPTDNPYWRARHGLPVQVQENEDLAAEAFTGATTLIGAGESVGEPGPDHASVTEEAVVMASPTPRRRLPAHRASRRR